MGQCPTWWSPCRIQVVPSVQRRKDWLTPSTRVLCSNVAKTRNPLKLALSGYIFATKAYIDNRKKLLSSSISSTCPHNMVNFGPLAAEIFSLVWGTPANFSRFRVLAALLHGTLVVGVSQTLRHWTECATYIRQGGHHVGHWPTFLVLCVFVLYCMLFFVFILCCYFGKVNVLVIHIV